MIQCFVIDKKLLNLLNGEMYVSYSYASREGLVKLCKTFKDQISGNQHLNRHRRDWFMQSLEDYINHKKCIIEHRHQDQEAALNKCWDAYVKFAALSTEDICSQFLKGYDFFVKILPSEKNNSYASSLHNLQELKKFCETYK